MVLLAAARVNGEVIPARAQMATTLGFHIILACLGIALPSAGSSQQRPAARHRGARAAVVGLVAVAALARRWRRR